MRGFRTAGMSILVLGALLAASCGANSAGAGPVPKGFPTDFPVPQGRVIDVNPNPGPKTVEFTVEAVQGVGQVEDWYRTQLAKTSWKPVPQGDAKDFLKMDSVDTAVYSDGTRTMKILVTDLGSTTKVTLTALVP